jgi:hypothetical protein
LLCGDHELFDLVDKRNVMSDKMIRNIQLISAATTVVLGVIQIANYYKESKKREKIES